jgi:hypothetical protein
LQPLAIRVELSTDLKCGVTRHAERV